MIFIIISFNISISDTITLSDIPDTVQFDLTEDFPSGTDIVVSKKGDIFLRTYFFKQNKSFILKFSCLGEFQGYIGKVGESPESYPSGVVWGMSVLGDSLFVLSSRKLTIYSTDGDYISSSILLSVPNKREGVIFNKNSYFVYGIAWDVDYKRNVYLMRDCIYEYKREGFNFTRSFLTTPLHPKLMELGFFAAWVEITDDSTMWVMIRPLPRITVVDLKGGRVIKKIKLRIKGIRRFRYLSHDKLQKEGIFDDDIRFFSTINEWSNSFSFMDYFYYLKDKDIVVLDYRNFHHGEKKHYLAFIDNKGKVLGVIDSPGRLLYRDINNNLYFAKDSVTILKGYIYE